MSVDNCLQEVINRPEDDFRELRTGQPFLYKNIQLLPPLNKYGHSAAF